MLQRDRHPEGTARTAHGAPTRDDGNGVDGVPCAVHEIPERMLGNQQLRFLDDLAGRMRTLSDPGEVMAVAATRLGGHLAAGRAGYGELDGAGTVLTVEREWTDGAMRSLVGRHRLDDCRLPGMNALETGRTVRLDDVRPDVLTAGESGAVDMRAGIAVPLVQSGRVSAAFYVHQAEPRCWRDDEMALTEEVARRTLEAVRRARANAALREREAWLRCYADQSTSVLWVFDPATHRLEYASRACEQVWGVSPEMLMDDWSRWTERVHRDDRQHVEDAFERVLDGAATTCEYRIVRPCGSVRWVRDTLFPICDAQGEVCRAAGLAQAIAGSEDGVVYVVDGEGAAQRALARALQDAGHAVKVFKNERAFLDVAPVLAPGCAVLALGAVDARGLAVVRELKARRIGLPIVATAARRGDVALAIQAMKAGVVDYLETPCPTESLLVAVASALASVQVATGRDRATEEARTRVATLSSRERQVLDGLLAGGTNKTIGKALGISPRTVEIHRAHVMDRLGARTLPELVLKGAAALEQASRGRQGIARGDAGRSPDHRSWPGAPPCAT